MKRVTKVFLAFFALVFLFSGCEDDVVTSELVLDFSKTGVIEIHLFAQLNKQELGMQHVPNGKKVLFSIDYEEFNPDATTGQWTHVGEVNNGVVLVESVPTRSGGVNVQITPEAFLYDQVQPYGSPTETIKKRFTATPTFTFVDVYPDQKTFMEIEYDYEDFGDQALTVNRRWQGTASFNQITMEITTLTPGTQITLYNNNWTTTVNSGVDGVFSADVPYNETFHIVFTALRTIPDDQGNPVQKLHRFFIYDKDPYFESSPVAEEIEFDDYEIWE